MFSSVGAPPQRPECCKTVTIGDGYFGALGIPLISGHEFGDGLVTAPDAGAIVYARYHHAINSTELATRLRQERSVLIVPGDHFDMDGYVRIGFGSDPTYLAHALSLAGKFLDAVTAHAR